MDGYAEKLAGEGRTTVLVALDGRAVGAIAIADAVRESSKQAVASLRSLGVRAVMLTGDGRATGDGVNDAPVVVVGPKELPRLMGTFGRYAGKLRRAPPSSSVSSTMPSATPKWPR